MKRNIIYFLLLIITCSYMFFSGCTKAPRGYLSSYIYYGQYLVVVPRGQIFASLNNNIIDGGSTPPYQVKMTHVYDAETGNQLDSIFFRNYPTYKWTGLYNPFVDSTMDLVNSLRQSIDTLAIGLNIAGGRLEANMGSINLPLGTYVFDMEVTNSAGTKSYPKVGSFQIVDPPLTNGVSGISDTVKAVADDSYIGTADNPVVTVTRIGTDTSQKTIILQVVDKNGRSFNPAAGELTGTSNRSGNVFFPTLRNYAIASSITDSSLVYQFPLIPFPYFVASGIYSGNPGFFYQIPTQYLLFDNFSNNLYNANINFFTNINVGGTYLIVVQLPDVTHS